MAALRAGSWFVPLCLFVATLVTVIASVPSDATAGIFASCDSIRAESREQDLAKVQRFLERKVMRQKLSDYGVSPAEAEARIRGLDDRELHLLASKVDRIPEGSSMVGVDGEGMAWILLAVAAIVVVVMLILLGIKVVANEILHKPPVEDAPSS